jgi:hypothetical protein
MNLRVNQIIFVDIFSNPPPLLELRRDTDSSTFSQGLMNISKFVGNILEDNIEVVSLRKT